MKKPEKIYFDWRDLKGNTYYKEFKCNTDKGKHKTLLGDLEILIDGEYYWEIKLIDTCNIKIGIIGKNDCYLENWDNSNEIKLKPLERKINLEIPFSEKETGYCIYNNGETRQNSSKKGRKISRNLINGDIIGIHIKNNFLGYWLNDDFLGWIFDIKSNNSDIFIPAISLLLEGEKVEFIEN